MGEMNSTYNLSNFKDLKHKYEKGHEYISLSKIDKMLSIANIDLNCQKYFIFIFLQFVFFVCLMSPKQILLLFCVLVFLELDQFFINIISLFTWSAFMYKKFHKIRNAYWFFREAERIGDSLSSNNNEDLLCAIARVEIGLSNMIYESGL